MTATTAAYLAEYFMPRPAFAAACGIDDDALSALLAAALIPSPSYVVAGHVLHSAAFGAIACDDAADGEYFRAAAAVWAGRALTARAAGAETAAAACDRDFAQALRTSLWDWHRREWPLPDCFDAAGHVLDRGFEHRLQSFLAAHKHGIFGLCVARPESVDAIVEKELLQERLTELAADAQPGLDTASLHRLIDRYAAAAMPFSPLEYPRSSRKRLVEDFRAQLPLPA